MPNRVCWIRRLAAPLGLLLVAGAPALSAQGEDPGMARRREEYFYRQRRFPFARIPAHPTRSQLQTRFRTGPQLAPNTVSGWTPLGPAPIVGNDAGRISAIAIDPSNPSIIYVGAAQGGIWKTSNAGASWSPLTDNECSLAIGSIALDPVNPNIVYAGTGEANFSLDSYYGCGILKSTNGGLSWTTLGGSIFDTPTGGAHIGRIYFPAGQGPGASNLLYAATTFGLYKSTDAGGSWTLVHRPSGTLATDVITDPGNASVVYVASTSTGSGSNNGLYKSTDGGGSFSKVAGGFPTANVGRISLAISPAAPQTVFAAVQSTATGNFGNLLGLFKSTDAGASWSQLPASGINCATQCWYGMVLAVDPADLNTVYLGALSLYKSTNGGTSFTNVGGAIHVDHHDFAFDPTSSSILYSANDGGIYRSGNAGGSWTSLNTNLNITQFYPGISVAPTGASSILGGTQDNGTVQHTGSPAWPRVLGGDGGFTATNPGLPSESFAETQWGSGFSGPRRNIGAGYFQIINGINLGDEALFIPPLVMDQVRPATLYFGTSTLYKTTNGGNAWSTLGALTATGVLSAIAPAASDLNTVYLGTDRGELFTTTNGGSGFSLRNSGLPTRYITAFAVHRSNPLIAYVTFSGFNAQPPAGHVFKTVNGGVSWTNVSGDLLDVPVNAIVLLPDGELDIGTDLGVYRSSNDGSSWSPFAGGLPNVAVVDLLFHWGSATLVAATHGRGMWSAQVNVTAPVTSLLMGTQPGAGTSGAPLVPPPVVTLRTASGDVAKDAASPVTATLQVVTGTGALSGTTSVTASNGVATFSNLVVTGSGTFTLTFTAPGVPAVVSAVFSVTIPPTQLALGTAPSPTATNGLVLNVQPVIELRDASGALVPTATNLVSASLNVLSGAGTLGGTVAVNAVNGLAAFSNLKITGVGTFTLTFSATGLTPVTSGTITVSAGPAAKLAITVQPAGAADGTPFSTQPVVEVEDAFGARVPGATNQVTATLNVVTGSGILTGAAAINAAGGVAAYSGLAIAGSGTFRLAFAAAGLTGVTSNLVTLAAGSGNQLALVTPPSSSVASGAAFPQQPVIQLRDASNNPLAQAGVVVTAAIGSGGGTLGGTPTATTDASGMAGFVNLSIAGAVGGRTLVFAAAGFSSVSSGLINVSAGAAAQLTMVTQPSTAAQSSLPFLQQPSLQLRDASGNPVSQAGVVVTATIATGGGTLGGTVVATTNAGGLAVFTNLRITGAPGDRTLGFAAPGLSGATSSTITLSPGPASQLTISTQPAASVASGEPFATQPVLAIRDAAGTLLAGATSQVTASLNVVSGAGTLGGTLQVSASSGVAMFSNLQITGTGTFTLTFSAPGLTPAVSQIIVAVPSFLLSIEGAGNGTGTVSGGAIACSYTGTAAMGVCSKTFATGSTVTLTAAPGEGSVFVGWTAGGCSGTAPCALTLTAPVTLRAAFRTVASLATSAADELLGTPQLSADEKLYFDAQGNHNGSFDLGDVLAFLDRTGVALAPGVLDLLTRKRASPIP